MPGATHYVQPPSPAAPAFPNPALVLEKLEERVMRLVCQVAHERAEECEKRTGHCIEVVRELSPRTPVAVCHGTDATWDDICFLFAEGLPPGEEV